MEFDIPAPNRTFISPVFSVSDPRTEWRMEDGAGMEDDSPDIPDQIPA